MSRFVSVSTLFRWFVSADSVVVQSFSTGQLRHIVSHITVPPSTQPQNHTKRTRRMVASSEDMSTPTTAKSPSSIEIKSCAIGGHLLHKGTAVKKELEGQYPGTKVSNEMGLPLQFSIKKDGENVPLGPLTMIKLVLGRTSPAKFAQHIKQSTETP